MIKLLFLATSQPLIAETVILTTVPDDERHLEPITSLGGIPLDAGAQVRIGAFPGMDDAALLDSAAADGAAAAFVPFATAAAVGQGVGGVAGGFEVSFRDVDANGLAGEVISLMVETGDGEFLITRFPGETFSATSETGLEPLRTLHLADATLVVGSRIGEAMLSTSPPPATGSYASWIAGFPTITDPALRAPNADADGDGRSNFLEYATGGDPTNPGDAPACEIVPDGVGASGCGFGACRASAQCDTHRSHRSSWSSGPMIPHTSRRIRITRQCCACM